MRTGRGLIIFPGALGDLVCLLPTIEALRRRYPSIEFELMARSDLALFARQHLRLADGHSIDRYEVALLFRADGGEVPAATRFFGQFERIECFFASDNQTFRAALTQAARGVVSFYPFRPPGSGHVGASVPSPLLAEIELQPEDVHSAERTLATLALQPQRFVLILPGSGSAKKNWPAENFALLAEKANRTVGSVTVLGPAEEGLLGFFSSRGLQVLNNVDLGQLAAIARLARCFIGNDSGVSHLAAASGARGVVLFGPTDPTRWHPLGNVRILHREPLDALLLDEVWPHVLELLERGL